MRARGWQQGNKAITGSSTQLAAEQGGGKSDTRASQGSGQYYT